MLHLFTGTQVRQSEKALLEAGQGPELMRKAAWGLAQGVIDVLRARQRLLPGTLVAGLIGSGNNGGDGLWALSFLARRGMKVCAVQLGEQTHPQGRAAFEAAGGRWVDTSHKEYRNADVLLDAVLGTGAQGAWQAPELPDDALVIACDVPSGVNADTGIVEGEAISADLTVTFGALKLGLFISDGAAYSGDVLLVDIGLGPHLGQSNVKLLEPEDIPALVPQTAAQNHKYTRGVLGVLAGSGQYPGAAILVCSGALSSGVGMIRFVREAITDLFGHDVVRAHPEIVLTDSTHVRVQAWVVGSGLGDEPHRRVQATSVLDKAAQRGVPVVVDANALELVEPDPSDQVQRILTPHAGEATALLKRLGVTLTREEVERWPLQAARQLAGLTGDVIVLKGPQTIIANRDEYYVYPGGHPYLATAGSGDTLAGICGSLITGWSEQEQAPSLASQAAAAVWLHGAASFRTADKGPFGARALGPAIAEVISELH